MECTNCGAELDLSLDSCEYCGRGVPRVEAPAPAPQPALGARRDEGSFKCRACGHVGEPELARRLSRLGGIMMLMFLVTCMPLFFIPLLIPSLREQAARCGRCRSWLTPYFAA